MHTCMHAHVHTHTHTHTHTIENLEGNRNHAGQGVALRATVYIEAGVQRRSRLVISSGRSGQLTGHICTQKLSQHGHHMHAHCSVTVDRLPNIPIKQ